LNNEGTLLQSFRTGSRTIEAVAITPDGKYIAASGETTGGETGIYMLNIEGTVLWSYRASRYSTNNRSTKFTSVSVTSDGNYIAAANRRDKLCLLSEGLLLWLNRIEIEFPSLAMTPDGKYIVAGSSDNNVYLFQLLNEQEAINNDTQMDV
jgi:WD40 repeat protein